jgi:uncharacterized protein YdeI (YjbR/CyaY-like superfamily)
MLQRSSRVRKSKRLASYRFDFTQPFQQSIHQLNYPMEPLFFSTPDQFRAWLEKNHDKEKEILVLFHKTKTGKQCMTWPQSVDEALCFGWIDGIRKSIDDSSYTIRFTPRKPLSIWSAVNVRRAEQLIKQGLMKPAGRAAFEKLDADRSKVYSFEQGRIEFSNEFKKQLKNNKRAWKNFKSMAPSYQRAATWWVMNAKKEVTRQRRLKTLIQDSSEGMRIKPMRYVKK